LRQAIGITDKQAETGSSGDSNRGPGVGSSLQTRPSEDGRAGGVVTILNAQNEGSSSTSSVPGQLDGLTLNNVGRSIDGQRICSRDSEQDGSGKFGEHSDRVG